MQLGPYTLPNNIFAAPMAGVTDKPFRQLCRQLGAGYAVAEMAAANPLLWQTRKSKKRVADRDEPEPRAVQITGADPAMMAECARHHVGLGAQIIDINMGCPVKKVCNNWSGSALLRDEKRVADILEAVVKAVAVPVTLKYRTGWNRENKNAVTVAKIAEAAGIAMLTLHGRTREDIYNGEAEYDTIAQVKQAISIPLVANGDIDSPEKARKVLEATGADAIMIGRAAQGRPWIFREIAHYLRTGELMPPPDVAEVQHLIRQHLLAHYDFHGEIAGVRSARKHIGWYTNNLHGSEVFRKHINLTDSCTEQLDEVDAFFESQLQYGKKLQYGNLPHVSFVS
ncbi:MAG: tRNA dihydrouridine synthase DusB [Burkholderiaceae bacterium]|jgi:tRNA-dihydrouridine synthase B|nr:tRNA dihydrouridine synthase DusB [Burkholderiaceae bacterium]